MKFKIVFQAAFFIFLFFITSCETPEEKVVRLEKERVELIERERQHQEQLKNSPKCQLLLELKQVSTTLDLEQHAKDAMNAVEFTIPADYNTFNSWAEGQEILRAEKTGSLLLEGKIQSYVITVKQKLYNDIGKEPSAKVQWCGFILKNESLTLDLKQSIKNGMNKSAFQMPIDLGFVNIQVGQNLIDELKMGSFLTNGSVNSWVIERVE